MNEITRRNPSDDGSKLPASVSKPGNLLDAALAHLPAEQRQELTQKALERKLEIDVEAKKADMRYQASSVDMANTIHQVRALENSTKSDYTVRAEYETASGRTNVEIKKSNNMVIIIIAIVIGIVALILLSKMK